MRRSLMAIASMTITPNPVSWPLGEFVDGTLTVTVDTDSFLSNVTATGMPDGVTYDVYGGGFVGKVDSAGSGEALVTAHDGAGDSLTETLTWTVTAPSTVTVDPVPLQLWTVGNEIDLVMSGRTTHSDPALTWSISNGTLPVGVTLDESQGTFSGRPDSPGADTVTITATDISGSDDSAALSWAVTKEPADPTEELVARLAPNVAAYVGRPGNIDAITQSKAHLPVVMSFIHGYTRGQGWTDEGIPEEPLQSVIVAVAARLLTNPRQVERYSVADYSETPAVLNGYTLAEIGVLHRYRRIQA